MKTPEKLRKRTLKAKETRLLLREAKSRLGVNIDSEKIEEATIGEETKLFWAEKAPILIRIDETLIPTLTYEPALERLPKVLVDMGAIPHVCSGADVMAPGIVSVQEFESNQLVVIRDERHGKVLAIGLSLLSSKEIQEKKRGKAIKNLHYVGDKIWNTYK
jgi:PUA domain protein